MTKKLATALLSVIIFLVPSNLFYTIDQTVGYSRGLRIDYLLPKLYLVDIFCWLFIIFIWYAGKLKFGKPTLLISVLIVAIVSRQFFTPYPVASIWFTVSVAWIYLYARTVSSALQQKLLNIEWISWAMLITCIFQTAIGLYQFIVQKSVFGYLLLGEPQLNSASGIFRTSIFGAEKSLAYGTTAHPNILAGVIIILTIIILNISKSIKSNQKRRILGGTALLCSALILLVTQSLTAAFTLLGYLIWNLFSQERMRTFIRVQKIFFAAVFIATPLVLFGADVVLNHHSIVRRNILNQSAVAMLTNNPVLGVGLNTFSAVAEKYTSSHQLDRFAQPAHHIGLLYLAETGLVGLVLFLLIWKRSHWQIPCPVLIVVPILSLDHYLYTVRSGQLLLLLLVVFVGFRGRYR